MKRALLALIVLIASTSNSQQVGPGSYLTVTVSSTPGGSELRGRWDGSFDGFSNRFLMIDASAETSGRVNLGVNYTCPKGLIPRLYLVVRNGREEVIEHEAIATGKINRQDLGCEIRTNVRKDFVADNWETIRDKKWTASVIVSDYDVDDL